MKLLMIVLLSLSFMNVAMSKEQKHCPKQYKEISCAKIKDAKRDYFCWKKGKLTDERTTKICQKPNGKKRMKKNAKKKAEAVKAK